MIHESFNRSRLLCLIGFVCVILSACSGSRQVAKTAEVRESAYYTDSLFVDSKLQLDTVRTERRDTARAIATESGTILIQRDDKGRPETIAWTVTKDLQSIAQGETRTESKVFSLDAQRNRELADTVHTVSKEAEEVTQTYDTAISLEKIIGPTLLLLVILYVIFVILSNTFWPWIKKKLQQ